MRRASLAAVALMAFATLAWSQQRSSGDLPAFGEYRYVEQLPEQVRRVEPVYPENAKQAGVHGVVLVQALVDRSGNVVDARVTRSIAMLDEAALDAVRQWRYRPAQSNGQPVAVWVAAPVMFGAYTPGSPSASPSRPAPASPSRPAPAPPQSPERMRTQDQPGSSAFALGDVFAVNGDPARRVIVVRVDGEHVWFQSPGQWDGNGVVTGRSYEGVFTYRSDARDRRNRGARGKHFGAVSLSGRWTIRGVYGNRMPVGFEETWTPLRPRALGREAVPPRSIGAEEPRQVLVDRAQPSLEHPVLPPPGRPAPDPGAEHPAWPPEWFRGDVSLQLAEHRPMDAPPQVLFHTAPHWRPDPGSPHTRVDELVVVRLRIDPQGGVGDAQIAKSVPELDAVALTTVRHWRYRPATLGGRPVPAVVYVPVRFASP